MIRRIVIKNGKKYIVNAAGWNDDVGPGAPEGTLWMQSTDQNWYSVNIIGTSGSATIYINQTPLAWQSPGEEAGNQLLLCNDGNSYVVYLTGTTPTVTLAVNQVPFTGSAYPKPDLLLGSITDTNYYMVTLKNNAGTIQPYVNQSYISASWVNKSGY